MISREVVRALATCDRIIAQLEAMNATADRIIDHLDRREQEQDVPLHQRGFGVMDEPPA